MLADMCLSHRIVKGMQCQLGSMSLHSLCVSTTVRIGLPCKRSMERDCCKAACRATYGKHCDMWLHAACGFQESAPPCLQGTNRSTLPCPLQIRRIWQTWWGTDYNPYSDSDLCLYFKTSKSSATQSHLHRTLHPRSTPWEGYATPLPFAVTATHGTKRQPVIP